jgi:hypothetical protein
VKRNGSSEMIDREKVSEGGGDVWSPVRAFRRSRAHVLRAFPHTAPGSATRTRGQAWSGFCMTTMMGTNRFWRRTRLVLEAA